MTEQDVTTAPVGADNMRGALTAYGIDPASSVTLTGARAVIGASDRGEGARAVWVYWVTEGCDVASRWDVPKIKGTFGIADSAITKDRKIGRLLARCGTHAADTMTVKRGGITLYRAAKRASNDWDAKTHAEAFGTLTGAPLRDAIWRAWDTLSARAAAGEDAYGRPRKTPPAETPAPEGAADIPGEGDAGEGDAGTLRTLTTDQTRADAAGSTLAAIKGAVTREAALTILAHAARVAALSGIGADDIMAEVAPFTEALTA